MIIPNLQRYLLHGISIAADVIEVVFWKFLRRLGGDTTFWGEQYDLGYVWKIDFEILKLIICLHFLLKQKRKGLWGVQAEAYSISLFRFDNPQELLYLQVFFISDQLVNRQVSTPSTHTPNPLLK